MNHSSFSSPIPRWLSACLLSLVLVRVSASPTSTQSDDAHIRPPIGAPQTAIVAAAASDDIQTVRAQLDVGVDPNVRNTALLVAAEKGNAEITELLLEKGANIEVTDEMRKTPLMSAAHTGQADVVKLLLAKGASVTARSYRGTALWEAAFSYNPRMERTTVALAARMAGAQNNYAEPKPARRLDTVQALLEAGSDVNAVGVDQLTVLLAAIESPAEDDPTPVVQLLIDHRARINDADARGWNAAMWTIRKGKDVQLLGLLLNHGTDLNARAKDGQTVLSMAVQSPFPQRPDYVGLLLEHGANANAADSQGATPLMHAAAYPFHPETNIAVIRALLAHGADVHARDQKSHDALEYAAKSCLSEEDIQHCKRKSDSETREIAGILK